MKRLLASAALLLAFSVPAFAGYIDQTGRPCTPGGAVECIWVDGPNANRGTDDDLLDLIVDLLDIF